MKNKLRSSRILWIVICVILFLAIAAGIVTAAIKLIQYSNGAAVTQSPEPEEEQIQSDEPQLYMPENRYSADGFYEIDGIRYYYAAGYEGVAGVDVSSYQTDIDWKAVKKSGIDFAIVRTGYRGWSTGELDEDDMFRDHMEGALEAGLDVGVYFFSQALNEQEAIEEAELTLKLIQDYEITGPVVFDWEEVDVADARTNEMNMLLLTACAEAFCKTVEEAGYDAAVYFNQAYGYQQLNLKSLSDYDFWLAEYSDYPTFLYDFQIWQYTNEGTVPGIDGNVDLNILFRKK